MNSLIVFNFDSQEIRFVDGQPVGVDVARVLGYKDPSSAVRDLVSPKNKSLGKLPGIRYGENKLRIEEIMLLKEAGIYQLIFGSKLPSAEKFQDWVFEEVLPSIQKTGQYSTSQSKDVTKPDLYIDDLERYVAIAERLTKLSNKELRSILEYQLIYLLQSLVPSESQSESKPVDYLYTKILNKVPTEGIKPANIKAGIRDLRHIPMSEVHKILKSLEEMSLGYMKNGLFFKN